MFTCKERGRTYLGSNFEAPPLKLGFYFSSPRNRSFLSVNSNLVQGETIVKESLFASFHLKVAEGSLNVRIFFFSSHTCGSLDTYRPLHEVGSFTWQRCPLATIPCVPVHGRAVAGEVGRGFSFYKYLTASSGMGVGLL